jgi:hypothetical protein
MMITEMNMLSVFLTVVAVLAVSFILTIALNPLSTSQNLKVYFADGLIEDGSRIKVEDSSVVLKVTGVRVYKIEGFTATDIDGSEVVVEVPDTGSVSGTIRSVHGTLSFYLYRSDFEVSSSAVPTDLSQAIVYTVTDMSTGQQLTALNLLDFSTEGLSHGVIDRIDGCKVYLSNDLRGLTSLTYQDSHVHDFSHLTAGVTVNSTGVVETLVLNKAYQVDEDDNITLGLPHSYSSSLGGSYIFSNGRDNTLQEDLIYFGDTLVSSFYVYNEPSLNLLTPTDDDKYVKEPVLRWEVTKHGADLHSHLTFTNHTSSSWDNNILTVNMASRTDDLEVFLYDTKLTTITATKEEYYEITTSTTTDGPVVSATNLWTGEPWVLTTEDFDGSFSLQNITDSDSVIVIYEGTTAISVQVGAEDLVVLPQYHVALTAASEVGEYKITFTTYFGDAPTISSLKIDGGDTSSSFSTAFEVYNKVEFTTSDNETYILWV